jgi:hypothetical protein
MWHGAPAPFPTALRAVHSTGSCTGCNHPVMPPHVMTRSQSMAALTRSRAGFFVQRRRTRDPDKQNPKQAWVLLTARTCRRVLAGPPHSAQILKWRFRSPSCLRAPIVFICVYVCGGAPVAFNKKCTQGGPLHPSAPLARVAQDGVGKRPRKGSGEAEMWRSRDRERRRQGAGHGRRWEGRWEGAAKVQQDG